MRFDERLKAYPVPRAEQQLAPRDAMLYALGIGLGYDPADERQLRFVYEDRLKVFPSMAAVLASPGFWLKAPDTGVDWLKVLHGEMGMELYRPIPAEGTLIGTTRVVDVIDKGPGKGALIVQERVVTIANTGEKVCTLTSITFARGNGGFGGPAKQAPEPHRLPDTPPHGVFAMATLPQAALLYRLSGDYNPLHADPTIAHAAGFERPILHGLCTYGVACHAIVRAVLDYESERVRSMQARFSAPVYPGETIRVDYWLDHRQISFRALAVERNVVVLSNGLLTFD